MTWCLFWNYVVIDPEVFFAPLLLGASGLAALGIAWAARSLGRAGHAHALRAVCVLLPLAWLLAALPSGFRAADRSRDSFADEYACSVLSALGTTEADIVIGLNHGVLVDYQVFPPRYYAWVLGYGCLHSWWFVPEDSDDSWRELVEHLGASDAEEEEWGAAPAGERPRILVDLALRRGHVYSMTSRWIADGGGYEEANGWLSGPRRDPPAAPADVARAKPWLDWARRSAAAHPDDRGVTSMGVAPLLALADEMVGRGRADLAVAVLTEGWNVAPGEPSLAAALARSLRMTGDADAAIALLNEARAGAARFTEWHSLSLELGHALHAAGLWEEAAAVLEDVIARRGAPGLSAQGIWRRERLALADCYAHLGRQRDRRRVLEPLEEHDRSEAGTALSTGRTLR